MVQSRSRNPEEYFLGTFICGSRHSGKTNLGMNIAKTLMEDDVVLFIIDPIKKWTEKFDKNNIKNIITVSSAELPSINWNEHHIFDTSRIDAETQRSFIENFSRAIMDLAAREKKQLRRMVIIEECHTPVPPDSYKSRKSANTIRMLTQGRNLSVEFIAITPSPTLCDINLIRLAQHRYFLHIDKKDVAYMKDFLGDKAKELPGLHSGECLYNYGNETIPMKTPIFGEAPLQLPPLKTIQKQEEYRKKFPHLTKAIRDSPQILIINKRSGIPYRFDAVPFGELACDINPNLITEISEGLFQMIQKFKLDFDYIICLPSGDKWVFPIATKLKKDIKRFYERPGHLKYTRDTVDLLKLPKEERTCVKTLIYTKYLYFRGDIKPGDKVLIIDDIVSTGETMRHVIDKLKEWGLNVIGVLCIVAKGQQYKKVIEDQFKIPVHYLYPLGFV